MTTQFAEVGGVENVVQSLAAELSQEHEVDLITRDRPQNTDNMPEDFSSVHVLEGTESYLGFLRKCRSFLRENQDKYDVFHFHNWSTILPAAGLDINSVLTTHGTTFDVQASSGNYLRASLYWMLEETAFNIPDRLTSVTKSHLEPFKIQPPVDIIRNGVDTDKYSPGETQEKSDKFEILIVGKHNQAKNHPTLIQAVSELENTKLLIPSDGPLTEQLKTQANKLGVDAEFSGRVSEHQLIHLYRRADLFCLPSKNEGLPLSMLESLSCGTPVLVSDVGDNDAIMEESNAGATLKSTEAKHVRSGIKHTRQQGLESMSDRARKYATGNLDWEQIANRYEEAFGSVHR
ncbi:MAG: glycosyltransferase family 4 protein [Candidatus Aenigmatarchaeota archaeon]